MMIGTEYCEGILIKIYDVVCRVCFHEYKGVNIILNIAKLTEGFKYYRVSTKVNDSVEVLICIIWPDFLESM